MFFENENVLIPFGAAIVVEKRGSQLVVWPRGANKGFRFNTVPYLEEYKNFLRGKGVVNKTSKKKSKKKAASND